MKHVWATHDRGFRNEMVVMGEVPATDDMRALRVISPSR